MGKVTRFDRESCRVVAAALAVALREFEREHGVKVTINGGKFDPGFYVPKLTISVVSTDGTAVASPEAAAFKAYAASEGLQPTDLGRTFRDFSGRDHRIIGFKPRATKAPVITESGGKRYKWPSEQVKVMLERSPVAAVAQ